ncbi:hypothetical protein V6N12_026043 [Hibiscus sabdariffa]|uniref:PGG domain-containing protein n=1 Tax=Hibiscus sabdariffa TaxID=183260 RepID=A0ABR2DQM3_9ROSI
MHKKHTTWRILKDAYATRAINLEDVVDDKAPYDELKVDKEMKKVVVESCREDCASILVVATLIATVTFVAAFTILRDLRTKGKNVGMAALIGKSVLQVFLLADTSVMVGSEIAISIVS